ncbi:MAG: thioredoxin domain-containing protein, partial [Cyanobacteria bacterium P01_G01_bin.54]
IMERLAEEYWKRAAVAKVDVEINQAIAKRYEIRSIPAVLILKGGEVVERAMGKQSYEFYKELIDKHL